METLDKLNQWLDQPVYEQGVVLYQQLLGDGFVLDMLKTGPDAYNRQTLLDALTAKRDELAAQRQARIETYPEDLLDSLEMGKTLMDERTAIKERMRMRLNSGVTESEEIKDWAFRILSIVDQLGGIYGRRDFFDEHGYLPDAVSVDHERTPAQLMQRMLTLRTYVSREGRKIRSRLSTEEQVRQATSKLREFQSELHQVENLLAATQQTLDDGSIPFA